mgnify:FL=1
MNKKIIIIVILSIVTGLVILNIINKENTIINETTEIEKNKNMLTMMLETEAGTGNYEEVTQSEWPQDGYVFNASLSRCENGGTLSWDDDAKKVIVQTNASDKCYIYFDIYNPTLAELCAGKTLSNCIKENIYTEDGANGLYYHDGIGTYTNASEEAGDNSYRYAGADPNNYVCFGSDEVSCADNNLYRIIGLFDDNKDGTYNIKLIKYDYATSDILGISGAYSQKYYYDTSFYKGNINIDYIGTYLWGEGRRPSYWELSSLNTINLNTTYWDNLGIKWQNLIITTTWNVSESYDLTALSVQNSYQNEIINSVETKIYEDEIGLMYVSDYGYAASPENWIIILSNYDNDINRNNNWLYMGLYEWTITPVSSLEAGAFGIYNLNYDGGISFILDTGGGLQPVAVRPCFYLNSDVTYVSGTGTQSDPFRIA